MLMWLGAIVSGYLGYRLHEVWVPAAVACAVVAVQAILFQAFSANRSMGLELYIFSLLMNLIVSYATYGIGRAIAQRRKAKR